ncbi:bifunctional solanapyrone synthase [Physcia stellaris]|nr:bifunctional solanapyrone synthase [Physcia stellaris]
MTRQFKMKAESGCALYKQVDAFLASLGISSSTIPLSARQTGGSQLACAVLEVGRQGEVVRPSDTVAYDTEREAHWSATAWKAPSCIYNPMSPQDVVYAVKVLNFTGSNFAIRGGGHTPFEGWANIDKGILISTSNLTDIVYDAISETVVVGAGNRWSDIYSHLEASSRMVLGGRVPDVGMGLLLGGGLSHLSNQYGLAADNVVSFDIVLANASMVTASAESNADLFFALKGGGNNFGIVTQVTMKTHPLGQVWGGVIAYNNTYVDALMNAFAKYQRSGQLDTKSAVISYMVFSQNINLVTLVYLAPVDRPAAFAPFYDIPSLYDQTRIHDTFSDLIGPPLDNGIPRWTWSTTTMYLDSPTYIEAATICQNQSAKLQSIANGTLVLLPQPISKSMITAASSTGGNPMGITPKEQMWLSLNLGWTKQSDDDKVPNIMDETIALIENLTETRGVYDPFKFLNDASPTQPVFHSYGERNLEKLKTAARKYDPHGMFEKQVPGGFKIF